MHLSEGYKRKKLAKLCFVLSISYSKMVLMLLALILISLYFYRYICESIDILPSTGDLLIIFVVLFYGCFFVLYDITLSREQRIAGRIYLLALYVLLLCSGILFFTSDLNIIKFLLRLLLLVIIVYFTCFMIKYRILFGDPKVIQYKDEGDYIKVIEHDKKEIDIASNIKGILPKIDKYPKDIIRECYYEMFECYYKMGNYDNAIKYLECLIEVDDKTKELIYKGLDYYELNQKLGLFYFPVFTHNLFSKYLKAKGKIESFLKKHLNLRTKIEYVLVAIFSLMFLFYSISTLTFDYTTTTNIAQNSLNYNPTYTLFLFSILISSIILLLVASLKIEKGYSKKIFDYGDHLVKNQEIESYLVKESELKKVYWILSISLPFTCICLTLPFTTWFADVSLNLTRISIYYITEGTFLVFLIYSIMPLIFVFVFLLSPFILFIYSSLTISVLKDFISPTYRNLTGRTIHESELVGYGYFVIAPPYVIGWCLIIFSAIFVITLEKPTHVTHFLAPVSLSIFLFIFTLNLVYKEFTTGSNKLIGDIYYRKEKYKEACDRYKKMEKHVNNKFYKTVFSPSDTFLSNLYMAYGDSKFRLGEREEALSLLSKSLEYAEKGNLTSYLWQIHYKIGQIKEEENKLEGAYENYKKSIEIIEDLRELVKIPERKEAFFENKAEVYAKMVVLCLRLGKDEEAFNYAERAKGRVFLELLGTEKVELKARHELKEKEEKLLRKIREIEAKLRERREERYLWELSKVMEEYDELLLKIKEEDPEYYSLRKVEPQTLKEIQSLLTENELILEFFVGDEVIAFIIQKDGMSVEKIPITKKELEAKIKDIRKKIDPLQMLSVPEPECMLSVKRVANELYQILIRKLEPMLNGKDLIIVPHGILHYLPFNALYDGESWFIEKYNARFLQNASMRRFLKEKRKEMIRNVLVVGNPTKDLEYAEKEAIDVAHKFNVNPLLGDEAKKEIVIESSINKDLLHLSCHAMFEAGFPRFSRLMLADDNLLVTEVYNLDLNADLVTLSACETGLGGLTNGDEVEGLTRAFMRAGTPSVIASLWKVDDESTSELFLKYYEGEGDKMKRLRDAQIEIMKKYGHPFYWAGFVMFGEG